MAITDEDLRAASAAVERARHPYHEALWARQALVRKALAQGIRAAHIARETGLSRTAVAKMRRGSPRGR